MELDDLLAARDKVNQQLQRIIDEHTEPWGVKVSTVEVKQIDLPQDMQRAMSKQAEAERERRAKVINADGEFQAAAKLSEAAEVLMRFPVAAAAALSADDAGDRLGAEHDHVLPAADGSHRAVAQTGSASGRKPTRSPDAREVGSARRPCRIRRLRLGGLAQLGERGVRNAEVEGSNPLPSTM